MKLKILINICIIGILCSTFIASGITINYKTDATLDNPTGFIEWEKTFDSGKYDISTCVQQTNDGGYICIGHAAYKVWLIKMDSLGNNEWDKFYEHDHPDYGRYVLQTNDNGYILLAETEVDDWEHVWIIKTDMNGTKEWERFYRNRKGSAGYCIQQTRDGGYIVTGYTTPLNWLNCYDTWLLKVNSLGYEEWNETYYSSFYNIGRSVQQTQDDGYIIVGGKSHNVDGNADIWLIKTDANGNKEWDRTYGDESTWNMGRCIQITSDGGFIILGENLLIKTNERGFELWRKPIGGTCVQQTNDDGFIITGFKEYWWKDIFKSTDLKLIKVNSEGKKDWTRIYGGEFRDAGLFVKQTQDDGFIVVGYKEFSKNYPAQERDFWIIKTGTEPVINEYNAHQKSIAIGRFKDQYNLKQIATVIFERFFNRFILPRYC